MAQLAHFYFLHITFPIETLPINLLVFSGWILFLFIEFKEVISGGKLTKKCETNGIVSLLFQCYHLVFTKL